MCGIAGTLDLTGTREFSRQRLRAMTGAIAHRGPDDEQFHVEPGLALGVRRLSVVDLEGGRQPLANEDGTVWVAYNGEMWDYPEWRQELLARGHRLATRCDTEAWVHLYEDFGTGMFDHAHGQFALALWDRSERTLILGRDRVGIAPLYYVERDGWLLWGSEVEALLASGLVAAHPDPMGIDYFCSFFCAPTTRTFFEGIKSIPPGHYLMIRDGRIEQRQYWDLDFPDAGQERRLVDPEPLVDELEALIEKAVRRRFHSDVPVVSYISGGLDSTVVLGMTRRVQGEAVPSFTIGLDRAGPDESSKAVESAHLLGSRLTTVTMTRADIAATYPELIEAAEGPVLDTSCACAIRLAAAVRAQGYKVAITGEGADEALAGYIWFKVQMVREMIRRRLGLGVLRGARRLMLAVTRSDAARRPPERAIGGVRPAQQDLFELTSQSRSRFYTEAMWDRLSDHDPYSDLDITNERIGRWHPLNQSIYVAYKTMLAGILMMAKGDRAARHSSIESRYPFLDDDITAFAAGIAPEYKLRGMTDKWILRQVAAKTLPPQIARRRKTMFRAVMSGCFLGPDRPAWVDQLLSPESLRASGVFQCEAVAGERAWLLHARRWSPRRFTSDVGLLNVLSTQLWLHTFCGGGLCELPTWTPPALASDRVPELVGSAP